MFSVCTEHIILNLTYKFTIQSTPGVLNPTSHGPLRHKENKIVLGLKYI